MPLGPGPGTEVGDDSKDDIEQDGVLDVASIITAGNKKMEEFLARKEKEKQEKGAKKSRDAAQALPKNTKLRNADRERATFTYEEVTYLDADTNRASNGANGISNGEGGDRPRGLVKKEVMVGIERFQAADGGTIERIADAIHLAISSVDDVSKRSEVWDNLIVVGNGAKIKGWLYSTGELVESMLMF
jgi:actin-related protein 9